MNVYIRTVEAARTTLRSVARCSRCDFSSIPTLPDGTITTYKTTIHPTTTAHCVVLYVCCDRLRVVIIIVIITIVVVVVVVAEGTFRRFRSSRV